MTAPLPDCALRKGTFGRACDRCGMIRQRSPDTVASIRCYGFTTPQQRFNDRARDLAAWRQMPRHGKAEAE